MLFFFFFNDTATTEIYTLSLHDALPISGELVVAAAAVNEHRQRHVFADRHRVVPAAGGDEDATDRKDVDRKSTRLNSSHANISYAVFCLKKKKSIYTLVLYIHIEYTTIH